MPKINPRKFWCIGYVNFISQLHASFLGLFAGNMMRNGIAVLAHWTFCYVDLSKENKTIHMAQGNCHID